jgi:hypothetical protein
MKAAKRNVLLLAAGSLVAPLLLYFVALAALDTGRLLLYGLAAALLISTIVSWAKLLGTARQLPRKGTDGKK